MRSIGEKVQFVKGTDYNKVRKERYDGFTQLIKAMTGK